MGRRELAAESANRLERNKKALIRSEAYLYYVLTIDGADCQSDHSFVVAWRLRAFEHIDNSEIGVCQFSETFDVRMQVGRSFVADLGFGQGGLSKAISG